MKVTLRPARLGDIPRMQEIEDDAGESFDAWGLVDFDDLAVVSIGEHAESIEAGLSFIAEVDGRSAGFVMGVMHEADAYLHELDVERAHQRKGFGALLVRAFADAARAKGARAVYLSTFRDPPWNAPFYGRLGFSEVARADYFDWMREIENQQAEFLDISTRAFMRMKL
jgi:GNAT superfamily N-acetyltransferase